VKIVRHRTEWALFYDSEAEKLKNCLGGLAVDIQHVGSTAVPGLISKPIIDIAVAVTSRADITAIVKRLLAIGYIDRGDQGASGGYLMVKESEQNVRISISISWKKPIRNGGITSFSATACAGMLKLVKNTPD